MEWEKAALLLEAAGRLRAVGRGSKRPEHRLDHGARLLLDERLVGQLRRQGLDGRKHHPGFRLPDPIPRPRRRRAVPARRLRRDRSHAQAGLPVEHGEDPPLAPGGGDVVRVHPFPFPPPLVFRLMSARSSPRRRPVACASPRHGWDASSERRVPRAPGQADPAPAGRSGPGRPAPRATDAV